METKKIVRAIDLGFGFTKMIETVKGGEAKAKAFPSIAAKASKKTLGGGHFAERDTETIEHDGILYEVGQDAAMAMTGYKGRVLDNRYIYSDTYQAIMKGALKMMRLNHIDLLVLGSPVKNYEEAAAHLKKTWEGTINLSTTSGENRKVKINQVKVIPQPIGGLAWYGHNNNEYNKLRQEINLVIDPGHFTLDWLVSHGMKMTPYSGSYEGGMAFVIKSIAQELGVDEGSQVTLNNIDECLYKGKPFYLNGKNCDLTGLMPIAQKTIRDSIDVMAANLGNAVQDVKNIILLGGAAELYAKEIKKLYPNHQIKIAKEPNLSNVLGFQWIGEQSLKPTK